MQLEFIQSKDLGFTKDQVLIVDDVYTLSNKATAFKEEVEQTWPSGKCYIEQLFTKHHLSEVNTSFF